MTITLIYWLRKIFNFIQFSQKLYMELFILDFESHSNRNTYYIAYDVLHELYFRITSSRRSIEKSQDLISPLLTLLFTRYYSAIFEVFPPSIFVTTSMRWHLKQTLSRAGSAGGGSLGGGNVPNPQVRKSISVCPRIPVSGFPISKILALFEGNFLTF